MCAPLPGLTGFAFGYSQTANFGGCSPRHLMWDLSRRARGFPGATSQWLPACSGILPRVMLVHCALGAIGRAALGISVLGLREALEPEDGASDGAVVRGGSGCVRATWAQECGAVALGLLQAGHTLGK